MGRNFELLTVRTPQSLDALRQKAAMIFFLGAQGNSFLLEMWSIEAIAVEVREHHQRVVKMAVFQALPFFFFFNGCSRVMLGDLFQQAKGHSLATRSMQDWLLL